jgi:quercetin dioxygenase-like cupin family protein
VTIVDLLAGDGRGPLWGTASADLNATLLAWPPGEGTPDHVNADRDVLVVVVDGDGMVELDGDGLRVRRGSCILVEKGRRRRIVAGDSGIRYLTAHVRRGGLQVGRVRRPGAC